MTKVVRFCLLLTILASSTQAISLPIGNLSIFQIVLLITGVTVILGILTKGSLKKGIFYCFALVFFISSILAYVLSNNPSWARSYLLYGFMTTMLVLAFPLFFSRSDIPLLEKTLIRSQYLTILFSLYSFVLFYFRGGIPTHIDLIAGMSIDLEEDFLRRMQISNQLRLALPYSTPPVLSAVMAMCIVILLSNKTLFKQKIRWPLIIVFAVILFLTGSRTGIAALALLGVTLFFSRKNKSKLSRRLAITGCLIALAIVLYLLGQKVAYIHKMILRMTSIFDGLMEDRHFLVPLDGLLIWVGSIKNFLLGIGFGSSLSMTGKHTFLPPYFLNSFVTLVAERGILGLFLSAYLVLFAGKHYKRRRRLTKAESALVLALVTGLYACLTYEVLNCYFFVLLIAVSQILSTKERKITIGDIAYA